MNAVNTDNFNVMREMLSEIELKLLGVDPIKQYQFYQPIKQMIFEAWQDACNPDDTFLYPKTDSTNNHE